MAMFLLALNVLSAQIGVVQYMYEVTRSTYLKTKLKLKINIPK